MQRRYLCIFLSLILILWLSPVMRNYERNISSIEETSTITIQGYGATPDDPFLINIDVYYIDVWEDYFDLYETRYLTLNVLADEIYFIYLDPVMWWELELYADPEYTVLLGTPYPVSLGELFEEYLLFSPNRTGAYYLKLHSNAPFFGLSLAVLTAEIYTINKSEIVIVGTDYHPIHIFQIDLEEGNYSMTYDVLYATIERGWDYVVFEQSYGRFPVGQDFYLEAGSYGIIIEESCEFCLTHYPYVNETPPEDPPDDPPNNSTNTEGGSLLDELTPFFGIGVLLGILVLYKMKKR